MIASVVREQFLAAEVLRLQEENEQLRERIVLLAQSFSALAGGTPLDVQLRMEEHA